MQRKIQVSHLPNLEEFDKQKINNLLETHYDKLSRILAKEVSLEVHFKERHKEGKRKLYEIKSKAVSGSIVLNSGASDWDIEKTLITTLSALEKEASKTKK